MIYQRLAAVFARYCAVHLTLTRSGAPLTDMSGAVLGHIDRITLRGPQINIEGWAAADNLVLCHAGQTQDRMPNLPRVDVATAYPDLRLPNPGFCITLPKGDGGATLTLIRQGVHFVHPVPMPDARQIRRAQAALLVPFIRDLILAVPVLLHWLATRDPADRGRMKQRLRLGTTVQATAMQPYLFVLDTPEKTIFARKARTSAKLPPPAVAQSAITIILPVYNALDLLPDVLTRVVRHTDVPWRLFLIEDASTDPAVRPFLRRWVADQNGTFPDRISLIEHTENQGFIRSVNKGLAIAVARGENAVLLNSDALVPQGWASRLMRPFLLHDNVASVTPMSNDAEIYSAPVICQRSPLAPGDADAIDAVAATLHPDAALAEAPTAVGFCMAISIDYLRRLPAFDTSFGRGYGEEVDWCQKARALGGRHLGLGNLFVEHRGGASFGSAEKKRLVARNNAEISRRHPDYDADVQRFIAEDPLAAPRLALAIAGAARQAKAAIPLYLAHSLGGGAEDYLSHRITANLPAAALVLRVGGAMRWQLELHSVHGVTRGGTDDFSLIKRLLTPVDQLHIVYSCGVGDPDPVDLPARLLALRRAGRDGLEVLIHDYLPVSPSYTLMNDAGHYLGLPHPATHDPAHLQRRPDGTVLSLTDWQAAWGNLALQADKVTAFSRVSAETFAKAYPFCGEKLRVTPHQSLVDLPRSPPVIRPGPPVIGVLGNIGYHKGAGVLRDLSRMLDQSQAASLVVLGQLDPMFALGASAHLHGGYLRSEIPALAARFRITDWLIPSIWPETFSYTTHEAISTGLPVWCFDLGAQAEAVRGQPRGGTIAVPDGMPDLAALLAAIVRKPGATTKNNRESQAA